MNSKITDSIDNFEKALGELNEYLAIPVENKRDRAGVIKAFEFSFELAWKTLQKITKDEGLESGGPKSSLKNAFEMNLIKNSEESIYIEMLRDRNLMSHVYRDELSKEIFNRIKKQYVNVLNNLLNELKRRFK